MPEKKWIRDAVKPSDKGKLRAKLKVKKGEKIPEEKLEKATNSKNSKLKKEAVLAETLNKLRKKK